MPTVPAQLAKRLTRDAALLLLRVGLGATLFLRHGLEKMTNFSEMARQFPDPLHLGATPSLVVALLSDAVASILVLVGLTTRAAAALAACNVAVAWLFVHHLEFFGKGEPGEVCCLYVCGYAAVALAGGGRYSVDGLLAGRRQARTERAPLVKA